MVYNLPMFQLDVLVILRAKVLYVFIIFIVSPHNHLQVLKIAILSEKYAHDYTWYVDTILNLIRLTGDYVSEEVWYRIVQAVITLKRCRDMQPRHALR